MWTNWGGNVSFAPAQKAFPRSEEAVVGVVVDALAEGARVRAVGAGHSFSPLVQTGGVLVDLGHLAGITAVDAERRRVSVRPGTTIRELGPQLWEYGFALSNQGDIDTQTIAGAVATATHGSGLNFTSLSGAVRSVRVVDGLGGVVEIGESDHARLHAAQVSLGALGLITELTIEVSPAYCLRERSQMMSYDEIVQRWDELLSGFRHFSFFWLPRDGSAALYQLETPPGGDRAASTGLSSSYSFTQQSSARSPPGGRLQLVQRCRAVAREPEE